jgi:hypothetical protein
MVDISIAMIDELETLAAWHRTNADHSESGWVWELSVRAAEDLERQAADLRARLSRAWGSTLAAAPCRGRSPARSDHRAGQR